ncbi:hypothetical protein Fmac_000872 [Flemingia macrophylla]|uniref:ATP-grasp domain-containing protein n=1 Tax=Flemingia macrophylla TaxID=520843 RepID=A0ABD1NFH2_9FABA
MSNHIGHEYNRQQWDNKVGQLTVGRTLNPGVKLQWLIHSWHTQPPTMAMAYRISNFPKTTPLNHLLLLPHEFTFLPQNQNDAAPPTAFSTLPFRRLAPAPPRTSLPAAVAEGAAAKVGKRRDIKKILILGAGPIVIGQACEFDYSGTQACKALREEGYEVVLINSNPATIMTDPGTADRTYVTPMSPDLVERTALNLAVALAESGALDRYGVELIGAKLDAIKKAEDRDLFKQAMSNIGIKTPPSGIGTTLDECIQISNRIGEFPVIVRPAFTLGGTGGGIAYNREDLVDICMAGLAASLTNQVLIEKSLLGWKEYELEVMRDLADNVVIICSIENIDPMGVHTGDSITVAPAQTLTDKEYQRLRDYSIAIIREIGVECGGSNVQFAVNPQNGEVMVIEMNPRVSRSSALASKATGFPIAKMAAKLSVGRPQLALSLPLIMWLLR